MADPEGRKIVAVVGPTGSGKSALALELAHALGGEIVSADSRQVYRYMDIGTAKPGAEARAAVPHHLLDVVDPDEPYSLALFVRQARLAIEDAGARGRTAVLVGGTGQYVWGLLEGWQVPEVPPDMEFRQAAQARAAEEGPLALHRHLAQLDPEAARRIDPRNVRRVVRALEVRHRAPQSPSQPSRQDPGIEPLIIGLGLPRVDLYRLIDHRVDRMVDAGWVGEVEGLMGRGYGPDLPSMFSLGYRELTQHLLGRTSLDEAVAEIKRRTRRFARQQSRWFRITDKRIRWHSPSAEGFAEAVGQATRFLGRS